MILVASCHDYANLGHNVARSLNSIGIDAIDACLYKHKFLYSSESNQVTKAEMKALSRMAEMVIIMHSSTQAYYICRPQNFAVYHSGTRYRSNPALMNKTFRKAHTLLTDQTEFMALANMHYVTSAIEDRGIKIHDRANPVIGHYPSNKVLKGSSAIEAALKNYKIDFNYKVLRHEENLERMEKCDIYIELFKPELNGREYGCFGVTAIEAGMMGKVVITQDLHREIYESTYGEHPFLLAEHISDLPKLVDYAIENIAELRIKTREIIYKNHTFEATGKRLAKILKL